MTVIRWVKYEQEKRKLFALLRVGKITVAEFETAIRRAAKKLKV
jgi:hypothetical protein